MRISDEVLKQVVFDSGDWASMRELCKNHEQYPVPLLGKTSIGEDIIIEVLIRSYHYGSLPRKRLGAKKLLLP